MLTDLRRYNSVGRHLVEPFRVVLAGAPNVGKSSLMNALAGFPRSIVTPIPGTTRDLVRLTLAADGWPIEFADTAGLRDATDPLEVQGIELARQALAEADVVLWLVDASSPGPVMPPSDLKNVLLVANKCDLSPGFILSDAARISAATGDGIPALLDQLVRRLVPDPPPPGAAVPFASELADALDAVTVAWSSRQIATVQHTLDRLLKCAVGSL